MLQATLCLSTNLKGPKAVNGDTDIFVARLAFNSYWEIGLYNYIHFTLINFIHHAVSNLLAKVN